MGISFKVSKIGRRFRPKRPPSPAPVATSVGESDKITNESSCSVARIPSKSQVIIAQAEAGGVGFSVASENGGKHVSPEREISFALNLFQDGFSIVKPSEIVKLQTPLEDMSKCSHPYNRMSQTLLSAIESGRLPADLLDDIPSKYYNGTIICEVRDYRKFMPEGTNGSSKEGTPIISKVPLRMSLENIVKDIPTISDDSWTYSNLMEVEARILKALQPQLCLDPTPMLDRLCSDTMINKLNLALSTGKRKRLPQMELTNSKKSQNLGKKICPGKVPENVCHGLGDLKATSCDLAGQRAHQSTTVQQSSCGAQAPILVRERSLPILPPTSQPSIAYPGINQDRFPLGTNNFSVINTQVPSSQIIMRSYSDKDNQDMQQTSLSSIKRPKQTPVGHEMNQRMMEIQVEASAGADMHWKNATLPQQMVGKVAQYSTSISGQKYFSPMVGDISSSEAGNSFNPNQQGLNISIKQEQNEIEKLDKQESDKLKNALQMSETGCSSMDHQRLRAQQLSPQSFMKPQISAQQPWHNMPSPVEKDPRKDDILSKRTVPQNPCVSVATSIQPPISTKSGDLSTGSLNGHFGVVTAASSFVSQKDKAATITNVALGSVSATSSHSDSIQKQPQKRKANSMTKSHAMSGVASPASVSNISMPLNASSPSVSTASMADPVMLDRFSKIDMITQRHQFNVKKNKVETFNVHKPSTYSKKEIARCLSNLTIAEDVRDPLKSMSKSIIGGTMNNCKSRIVTYAQPSMGRNRFRVFMNEKLLDGNVIMQYGDVEESDTHSHDCMIELSSTHHADLLAAQHKSLMERDGYQVIDDQTVARTNIGSGNSSSTPNMPLDGPAPDVQQPEEVSGQQSNVVLVNNNNSDTNHLSTPQNPPNNIRMLPPGNTHVLPMSQGYLPSGPTATVSTRPQQMEQALLQQQQSQQHQMQSSLQGQSQQSQIQGQSQQQQLQHSQIQRSSSSMLQVNPYSQLIGQNSTMQLGGNPMINKTQLQLQALQQQQAQQQQFPRKGMMGLGAMGMGNNMMGLGALNNVMGGARGISSPLAQMQGLSGIGANQINLSSATGFGAGIRSGLSQVAALKYRMQQSRMYGTQPGISSLPGNGSNQMLQSSMGMSLLGRPNMGPLPRTAIASMGPPKMPGTNIYMNQQHQLQLQQQQLQQLQQQQQQQQLQQPSQQPQQVCSPMQQSQVSSPSMIGSPPVATHQQQISPQQLSQQIAMSPQQLSGGTLQQINNGSTAGPGPASPQLSSQTHNSVGSISSSPMELQATNKAGSVNTG